MQSINVVTWFFLQICSGVQPLEMSTSTEAVKLKSRRTKFGKSTLKSLQTRIRF